ncbi:S-formylglutathione hydrolase [Zhongshania marina]|uniref:S-formylglutathione hydrolase n=1 Tax=Zhongshania marina TaxID=2304603 RepID=A0A2S4HKU7_9GAMM|nr:S-formylglutathione hydrolase [Marortus luteolus]POP54500.1 S-formylglutathione hydrolase [Marortus luteolus]
MKIHSQHLCFGGTQYYCQHSSIATGTAMNFSVFLPYQARIQELPALYYLPSLNCTEETFMIKAGAQRIAAELGMILVSSDTSPRGLAFPSESDHRDLGVGAGFYLDATKEPWAKHYRMGSYINLELPTYIEKHFPACNKYRGIFGHSMGGHGALVTALRNPDRWHSVSAFAPICNPSQVPWGEKAFTNYLGDNQLHWQDWDASLLLAKSAYPGDILIDQGLDDEFLQRELRPDALEKAAVTSHRKLNLRRHLGYGHDYYFIQSFIDDHLQHHARQLQRSVKACVGR